VQSEPEGTYNCRTVALMVFFYHRDTDFTCLYICGIPTPTEVGTFGYYNFIDTVQKSPKSDT